MDRRRLLKRLASGELKNVRFNDAMDLAIGLGFRTARTSGSHHILNHPEAPAMLNLQNIRGEAKPYQLRQLMRLVERYNLKLKEE